MKTGPKPRTPEERFDEMAVKTDTCWFWGGENWTKRYGTISLGQGLKSISAHRYSYMRFNGEIPRGLVVRHKCDVMNCVNPEHLELGTNEDNVDDRNSRGRSTGHGKVRLPKKKRRGNQRVLARWEAEKLREEYATGNFTQVQLASRWSVSQAVVSTTIRNKIHVEREPGRRVGHFKSKITVEQRQEIREKYQTGCFTQTQLAVEYGVTQTRVSDIITGRDYKRSDKSISNSELLTCQ